MYHKGINLNKTPMNYLQTFLTTLMLCGIGITKFYAQSTVKGVVIETVGGQRTEYALTEAPKLTYDGKVLNKTRFSEWQNTELMVQKL